MVYVGAACEHGFLTVADGTEIFYPMSQFCNADLPLRRGHSVFHIAWQEKVEVEVVSDRDRT